MTEAKANKLPIAICILTSVRWQRCHGTDSQSTASLLSRISICSAILPPNCHQCRPLQLAPAGSSGSSLCSQRSAPGQVTQSMPSKIEPSKNTKPEQWLLLQPLLAFICNI